MYGLPRMITSDLVNMVYVIPQTTEIHGNTKNILIIIPDRGI